LNHPFDIPADLDTPTSVYLKLGPLHPRFLLESVESGFQLARYSFLGFGAASEFRLDAAGLRQDGVTRPRPSGRAELLTAFRQALARTPRLEPGIPELPFAGGLVGVAGYDVVRNFERLQRPPTGPPAPAVPEAAYLAADSMLVFDHLTRRIALLHAGSEASRADLRREIMRLLRGPLPPPVVNARHGPALQSLSGDEFRAVVDKAKHYISLGDVYQLVLSVRFSGEHSLTPFETYRALRLLNPSPYMYFYDFGDFHIVGASPEILVRQEARLQSGVERQVVTVRPIAGTKPRGATPDEDEALARELLGDPKERAEHVMLIDLARNDIGRIAEIGSVKVTEQMVVEKYSHVQHIVSNVEGVLRPGMTSLDVLRATFPAGTLTGAPKVRAMEIIDELEPVKRGIYGGACGYLSFSGAMDLAIAIRTGIVKDGVLYVQAAAGIVADSVPENEWRETEAKARAVLRAAEQVQDGLGEEV